MGELLIGNRKIETVQARKENRMTPYPQSSGKLLQIRREYYIKGKLREQKRNLSKLKNTEMKNLRVEG